MKTAMIPKMLPWLARQAGVSDQRAEALWRTACRQAALTTGRQNGASYWGVALHNLLDALALERWRVYPLLAWPWLLMRGSLEHCVALTRSCLAPVNAAASARQIVAGGDRPGQVVDGRACSRSSASGPGASPRWLVCASAATDAGRPR